MGGWAAACVLVFFMLARRGWRPPRAGARALPPADNPLLLALTTIGLSIGTLSLVMLWIGLLGRPIDWRVAAIGCAIIGGSGLLLRDRLLLLPGDPLLATPPKPLRNAGLAARVIIGLLRGAVLCELA